MVNGEIGMLAGEMGQRSPVHVLLALPLVMLLVTFNQGFKVRTVYIDSERVIEARDSAMSPSGSKSTASESLYWVCATIACMLKLGAQL